MKGELHEKVAWAPAAHMGSAAFGEACACLVRVPTGMPTPYYLLSTS
jgi:hypothetical protein